MNRVKIPPLDADDREAAELLEAIRRDGVAVLRVPRQVADADELADLLAWLAERGR